MTRAYTLKKRAEKQAETRRRIVEATVDLHSTVGPAATTLSMIAERAGVQRHTLYAHFPDERSLFMACSSLAYERDPPPDPAAWCRIADRDERLAAGLRAVYDWYERNAGLMACIMRDREHHAPTREIVDRQLAPVVKGWIEALGDTLSGPQRAVLHLALSFHTWRSLVSESGLASGSAVAVMVKAIEA